MLSSIGLAAQQPSGTAQRSRGDLDEIRKISTMLGAEVKNKANEKIAKLDDLVLASDGTIQYAIVSHGGLAGVGASYFAIPWGGRFDVRHVQGKWVVTLDMTQDALGKAPMLKDSAYKELMNADWVTRDHDYFYPRTERETRTRVPAALPMVLRASKINDAKLKNHQDQDVGEVVDLLLDRNYRAVYAIVGHGGVLGIGESYIPVPWSSLRLTYNRDTTGVTAVIDATKAKLEQAPLVKENSYATMLAPGFAGQVNRYFGVTEPRP
jgi:sporulation protein YlmC with PRC-barrel domain